MTTPLIVALDFSDLEPCRRLLQELKGFVQIYKIGSELFTAHGWSAVELIQKSGGKVFLDLKLHDIPTTVTKTCRVIAGRGIFMLDVHALGGLEMMREARKAIDETCQGDSKPLLLAVTILTSLEEKILPRELGIQRPLRDEVLHLARLAKEAGLDGIISSPEEIEILRQEFGNQFILVTPGIRPSGSEPKDQRRTLTPREAMKRGANYLVVGRPITGSATPRQAAQEILQSLP
jgi:orotidine-5'-phosphate decarboxylase